jgi:uncharacterized membrane-anchored protein
MLNSHPLRVELHNEVHTRPRPPISAPHVIAHAAVMRAQAQQNCPQGLIDWCIRQDVAPPLPNASHFSVTHGSRRLRFESHGEFNEYTVYDAACQPQQPFAPNPADDWLQDLLSVDPGEVIAAIRLAVVSADSISPDHQTVAALFAAGRQSEDCELVAASLCDNAAVLYSDFQLDVTGFGRFLIVNQSARPAQLGHIAQDVIDMEVYRMMAMLAYPEARELDSVLRELEAGLSGLVARLDFAETSEEPAILQDVIRMAAEIEQLSTYSAYRLDTSVAYRRRVIKSHADLRESRVEWLETPTQFLERRFEPAMNYCEAVNERLQSVSARVGRASELLGTRTEIDRERQNQKLLAAMNQRAGVQLRLQETVEGLSIVAISYYSAGLLGYIFKATEKVGAPIAYELLTGLAVLPIVLVVRFFLHRSRHRINSAALAEHS